MSWAYSLEFLSSHHNIGIERHFQPNMSRFNLSLSASQWINTFSFSEHWSCLHKKSKKEPLAKNYLNGGPNDWIEINHEWLNVQQKNFCVADSTDSSLRM